MNQLLDAAEGNARNQHVGGGEGTATGNITNITSGGREDDDIGSLQSLMERSENFLGQMEGTFSGNEGSPAPRSRTHGERDNTSQEKDSDSDISIVGETPGNGSSALDSLGNFSLNSLLGGSGGDIGRSDSPLSRGSPHHHRMSSSSSALRSYPSPSAAFGSMASMTAAHHMMAPHYMTPGWGFPMWNPTGMSVPMPPSGPSIQHTDRHHKSHQSSASATTNNDDGSQEGAPNENRERTQESDTSRRGENDSPSRGINRGSPNIQSLSSASSSLPPFLSMPPPYGMPYSYPYSYPYLPPGMPPPAHSHSSSDSSSMRGYYPPPMPPYPATSFPSTKMKPSSMSWSGLSAQNSNDEKKDKSDN